MILDSLRNLFTSLGTLKDRSTTNRFTSRTRDQSELDAMLVDNWIAAIVAETPIKDAFREGVYISSTVVDVSDLIGQLETLHTDQVFSEAAMISRVYGGAIVVMVSDAVNFSSPLTAGETISALRVYDRYDATIKISTTRDVRDPLYRRPEYYTIEGVNIHHSRVLPFDGFALPWRLRQQNQYWGGSEIGRCYDVIRDAQSVMQNVGSLVNIHATDVFKTPGLESVTSSAEASTAVLTRFAAASWMRSNNNMIVLDTEEDYIRNSVSYAGLPEIWTRSLQAVSAASGIPQTKFLGDAASGLNATGAGDRNNYYDLVRGIQKSFTPNYLRLCQVLLGDDASDIAVSWEPLVRPSPSEIADLELKRAQRDQIYLDRGVITPEIVARDLQACETYVGVDGEYVEALAGLTAVTQE